LPIGRDDTLTVKVAAYAKINLALCVAGKRADGFHDVRSVIQSVTLRDMVSLEETDGGAITVRHNNAPGLPAAEENTAYKAAAAFFEAAGETAGDGGKGLAIEIEKNIPVRAGLGGASADAAAVLRGLNKLRGGMFGVEELCEIGARVGADVPFCVVGGACLCEGKGEIITVLPPIPPCIIVIAKGGDGVDTAEAYRKIDGLKSSYYAGKYNFDASCFSVNIQKAAAACFNIFEAVTELEDVAAIKAAMADGGALCSQMSGSGSAVFGIFTDMQSAERCRDDLVKRGFWSRITVPVPHH
jgi:4-diphosphocytidyl-2-C-methyl-D-erythritol kinase